MRLLFRQRLFSWFDSYDIYDEAGNTVYTVEGKLAWGHCLHILNAAGDHIGTVREQVLTFLPKFELYVQDQYVGCIQKEFTFFTPKFDIDCNGWRVEGDFLEWDYRVTEACGGAGGVHPQGAAPLDGHLRDRRGGPGQRAVRTDAGASHRRGEVLPELSAAQE